MRLKFVLALTALGLVPALAGPPVAWVNRSTGQPIKQNMLIGGDNGDGRLMPVCRGYHNNGWHAGKMLADMCNFGWGGKEIVTRSYQVLTGTGVWRRPANDLQHAYVGGGAQGESYRICRAAYGAGVHPGKVVRGRCNIGYGGREIVLDQFEALYPR